MEGLKSYSSSEERSQRRVEKYLPEVLDALTIARLLEQY